MTDYKLSDERFEAQRTVSRHFKIVPPPVSMAVGVLIGIFAAAILGNGSEISSGIGFFGGGGLGYFYAKQRENSFETAVEQEYRRILSKKV